MSDPLRLLHEYAQGERQVKEVTHNNEKYITFDEYAYPKDTPTQLLVYGKNPSEYYSVETILFLWDNRNLMHTTYVKEAASKNIKPVTRPDRREIIDYLKGDRVEIPSNHDAHHPPRAPIPVSRLLADSSEPDRKKPKLDPTADRGQRIDALLNKDKEDVQPDASQLRSLNDNLTADRIAALKKARMNHKKKTIAATADDDLEASREAGERVDRELKSRERTWRTRLNCMEATSKVFSPLLDMLKGLKTREEAEKQNAMGLAAPMTSKQQSQRPRQQAGYSRYDQEIFNKEMNADFQIDAEMSFVGANLNALHKGPVAEKKPLAGPAPLPPGMGAYGRPQQPSSANRASSSSSTGNQQKKRTNRTPIIIIPATGNSLISMYNVKDILQNMHYVTTDAKKKEGVKRENDTQIHKKRGDRGEVTVPYRIVDNPMKLRDDEWERVVAVFVMGPAWQFKGWRWNGNPVEIFTNIAAFHLHYDDLKIDANVAKWNVTALPISREKRHLDKARLAKFWDVLDKHIIKQKSFLRW